MAGIFQLFGVSFLFWVFIGIIRFVFETLHALRDAPHRLGLLNMLLASFAGIAVSISLFFIFFFGFGPVEGMMNESTFPTFALSILIVWLACVTIGSYLSTRIYIQNPYTVAVIVGVGTVSAGTALLFVAEIGFALTREALQWEAIWMSITIGAALLGGHMANAFNALEREQKERRKKAARGARITPDEVAIVIAAHNEELTIGATIESLMQFAKKENIYVGSDGSKDKTVDVVRHIGANVVDIQPNGGKAKALTRILAEFNIIEKYKAVFFVDADLKADAHFYAVALPQFDDPDVVAIVGHAKSLWPRHYIPQWRYFFTAYRIRLWRVLQFCLRYGQTWKYTNVSPIVPGGGSIYRSSALKHIRIHVPGMIIEDFNMTFNIHHQKLGKIAFNPGSYVWDQEPFSMRDYVKQITRWYTGFFQTIRHHGFWPSWFCLTLFLFTLELLFGSVFFLLTPFFLLELFLSGQTQIYPGFGYIGTPITLLGVIVTIIVIDYFITIVVALIERKPLLIVYGLFFFILRYIEAAVFLYAMFKGLLAKQNFDGKWVSPKRISYANK